MRAAYEELKESRERLLSLFSKGTVSEKFLSDYTEIIDQYFRRRLQESRIGQELFRERSPFAFVAVGGYGRAELCIYSDIDIMVLFDSKIPALAKELANDIFFPLWDLGLDLGYGIRNIRDCLKLSKDNFEVLTSMMDARFLCGDSPLYLSLTEDLRENAITKRTEVFGRWLKDRDTDRMEKFGDASYLLEPNLKEGIGGLRDYHQMLWLARAFFNCRVPRDLEYFGKLSHNEYRTLRSNLRFIWLVRNHLHYMSVRKNDRLGFEYQEKIARTLGFKNESGALAVEQFMGRLHACMASIKSLYRSFARGYLPRSRGEKKRFKRVDLEDGFIFDRDELNFESAKAILLNPFLLVGIFVQCSRLGCALSLEARRLVQDFLFLVDDAFRGSEKAVRAFLDIMNGTYTFGALEQMYETGFLDAFIPEFHKIRDRVQHDAYHIFPVGRHILQTVRYLKEVSDAEDVLLPDIFSDLSDPEPLFLAGLFHDIGKIGKGHAQKGGVITSAILTRFAYDEEATKDVVFLVKNHLFLVETSTRRDLSDEKIVVQCARTVGNAERLKMLYLLTWADSKATGPRAWNEWIASLVQELFFKILHMLEGKELATPLASEMAEKTRSQVRHLMADQIGRFDIDAFFENMSSRYILNTTAHEIMRHVAMSQDFQERLKGHKDKQLMLEAREDDSGGCWEVTFMAKDRPGLFSDLAGVLALKGINILSANIYTWLDGTAVDIFKVTSPLDPIHAGEIWETVRKDLRDIFSGRLSLEYRLGEISAPSLFLDPRRPSHPPQVIVDNDSSDFFTLIEVFADDRIGLLYLITRTLYDLRLDIRVARIATKGDQIADVFYVRDLEGQKIWDEERVREIKNALLYRVKQGKDPLR